MRGATNGLAGEGVGGPVGRIEGQEGAKGGMREREEREERGDLNQPQPESIAIPIKECGKE